jgi:hypothetical protein
MNDERRIRTGSDGSRNDLPALRWAQSSFIQPQMMVQDRYFYDPVAGNYTWTARECAISIFTTAKSSSRMSGMRGTR